MQKTKAQKSAVFLPTKSIKNRSNPHKPTLSSTSSMHRVGGQVGAVEHFADVSNKIARKESCQISTQTSEQRKRR